MKRIKCAAWKRDDGKVFEGDSHADILQQIRDENPEETKRFKNKESGFVTFDNDFVYRKQAAKIAFEAGQIPKPVNLLFSECLRYPNIYHEFEGLVHDKYQHYAERICIPMSGAPYPLTDKNGLNLCSGYSRIVVGDRGPYVEINPSEINFDNVYELPEEYWRVNSPKAYYRHFTSKHKEIKIYYQLKPVTYADYRIGKYYISPFDLYYNDQVLIEPLNKGK